MFTFKVHRWILVDATQSTDASVLLSREVTLPMPPYKGLLLQGHDYEFELDSVGYRLDIERFEAWVEPCTDLNDAVNFSDEVQGKLNQIVAEHEDCGWEVAA